MIHISTPSISNPLSLEATVSRLKDSPLVDGIAEFGSRSTRHVTIASDYDLLILVKSLPAPVFQMATTIDGRLADIVLVTSETAEALLTATEPPQPRSFEALFAHKMRVAQILYDGSERLHRVKQLVTDETWQVRLSDDQYDSDSYATWFWQSHGLLHLERMAQSPDPVHLSAVDMMLTANLSMTWRSYFDTRRVAWEGEKTAVRYWAKHDEAYLQLVRKCLAATDRNQKLALYRDLVTRALEPVGPAFQKGETAVMLAGSNTKAEVQTTLQYWDGLFNS